MQRYPRPKKDPKTKSEQAHQRSPIPVLNANPLPIPRPVRPGFSQAAASPQAYPPAASAPYYLQNQFQHPVAATFPPQWQDPVGRPRSRPPLRLPLPSSSPPQGFGLQNFQPYPPAISFQGFEPDPYLPPRYPLMAVPAPALEPPIAQLQFACSSAEGSYVFNNQLFNVFDGKAFHPFYTQIQIHHVLMGFINQQWVIQDVKIGVIHQPAPFVGYNAICAFWVSDRVPAVLPPIPMIPQIEGLTTEPDLTQTSPELAAYFRSLPFERKKIPEPVQDPIPLDFLALREEYSRSKELHLLNVIDEFAKFTLATRGSQASTHHIAQVFQMRIFVAREKIQRCSGHDQKQSLAADLVQSLEDFAQKIVPTMPLNTLSHFDNAMQNPNFRRLHKQEAAISDRLPRHRRNLSI